MEMAILPWYGESNSNLGLKRCPCIMSITVTNNITLGQRLYGKLKRKKKKLNGFFIYFLNKLN